MNKNVFIFITFLGLVSAELSQAEETLEQDKMYISSGSEIILVNLENNPISSELVNILPLKPKQLQENEVSKLLQLSVQIESAKQINTFAKKAYKGDLFLLKGNSLLFAKESFDIEVDGYVKIGKIKNMEKLIEVFETNKNIVLWNTLNYYNHQGGRHPYDYFKIINYLTWKTLTFICFLFL